MSEFTNDAKKMLELVGGRDNIVSLNISCYEGHRYAFEIHQYT